MEHIFYLCIVNGIMLTSVVNGESFISLVNGMLFTSLWDASLISFHIGVLIFWTKDSVASLVNVVKLQRAHDVASTWHGG